MRLDLSQSFTTGRCTDVNLRPEFHGEDRVMAMDFSITFDASNDILDIFHPKLRAALFWNEAGDKGQASVEGVPETLPNYLFPQLGAFKWEAQLSGYTFEVDYGMGDETSNIELTSCKVGKFKLTPKEGGSVNVALQVQASTDPLTAEDKGLLQDLPAKPTIQFKLTPPRDGGAAAGGRSAGRHQADAGAGTRGAAGDPGMNPAAGVAVLGEGEQQ